MITVRITNHGEVVRQHSGWCAANVGGLFLDLADRVEAAIAEEISKSLAAQGVVAVIERVPDPEPDPAAPAPAQPA